MSVIIVEDGNKGLGIYSPQAVAAPGTSVTIFNRTKCKLKMYDPNVVLANEPDLTSSTTVRIIDPEETAIFYVKKSKQAGIYGYSIFAQCDENYEVLKAINGTPRIIIVSS